MIVIGDQRPTNREHVSRLLAFCGEVMAVCRRLGIEPVLSGSLAVFGYTRNTAMRVNDVDLACSERDFPRLGRALHAAGIAHQVRPWHVLQARRDDLKIEFDSMEHWLADLAGECETLAIEGLLFRVVGLADLQELYRRGLKATAEGGDAANPAKHAALAERVEALGGCRGKMAAARHGLLLRFDLVWQHMPWINPR